VIRARLRGRNAHSAIAVTGPAANPCFNPTRDTRPTHPGTDSTYSGFPLATREARRPGTDTPEIVIHDNRSFNNG